MLVCAQSTHGCGDLIFSSHTTFMLVGMLTYNEYGTLTPIKVGRMAACTVHWNDVKARQAAGRFDLWFEQVHLASCP